MKLYPNEQKKIQNRNIKKWRFLKEDVTIETRHYSNTMGLCGLRKIDKESAFHCNNFGKGK